MERKMPLLRVFMTMLILLISAIYATQSFAAQVTLTWDPNSESDLAGYKIYWGTSSGNYQWKVDVSNVTTYTVTGLSQGVTHYFAATAYNNQGLESGFSNEVVWTSIVTYSLAVSKAGTGSGTVTSSPTGINCGTTCSATYQPGTIITLTVVPTSGSSFTSWSGSSCSGSGTCVFSLNGNSTVTATFSPAPKYTLTASAGTGGSVSPSGNKIVNSGASQTYLITPLSGYKVSAVTVDGSNIGAVTSYTFSNVTANHTISATFSVLTYTLTASAKSGGTISPTGTKTVNYGASQTYTIAASTGYKLSDVLVDNISVGAKNSYTFSSINANHSIIAYFVPTSWTSDCCLMAPVETLADYGATGSFKLRLNYSTLPSGGTKFVKGQSYPNGPWIEYTPNVQGELTLEYNFGGYFEFSYGVRVGTTEYWISPACSRFVYPANASPSDQHFRLQLGTPRSCSKNISDTLVRGVTKLSTGKYRIYLNFLVLPLKNYQKLFVQGQSAPNSAWIEYPVANSNPCFSFDITWPIGGGPINFSFGVVKSDGSQQWIDPNGSKYLCSGHLCVNPESY